MSEEFDVTKAARENAHISDDELQCDIDDTEREIVQMEEELAHLRATPHLSSDYRWNHMRASARETGIEQRRAFIAKLKAIQKYRADNYEPPDDPVAWSGGFADNH